MALNVNIKKKFKNFMLDVSFESDNEIIGILGSSGSGKSLTLKCISGLEKPDEGIIKLNDKILFDSSKSINLHPRDRKVGFLFQNYALFPHMTVEDNIAFGINYLPEKKRMDKVYEYLKRIRLDDMGKRYPRQLSGGQQQRVAIARAMVMEPDIFLLDEPFSALDQHLRYQMELQVKEILSDFKGTSIFVSHDIDETYRISDRILVYGQGTISSNGLKDEIFSNPNTVESAKITGFKNIKEISKKHENVYEIKGLGICVEISQKKIGAKYMGIRSHHIKWVKNREENLINTFKCKIVQKTESPFEVDLTISFENGEDTLRWQISKEIWEDILAYEGDLYVEIPHEKIILI
jgi:molybdate transport system ATP-binding protein